MFYTIYPMFPVSIHLPLSLMLPLPWLLPLAIPGTFQTYSHCKTLHLHFPLSGMLFWTLDIYMACFLIFHMALFKHSLAVRCSPTTLFKILFHQTDTLHSPLIHFPNLTFSTVLRCIRPSNYFIYFIY